MPRSDATQVDTGNALATTGVAFSPGNPCRFVIAKQKINHMPQAITGMTTMVTATMYNANPRLIGRCDRRKPKSTGVGHRLQPCSGDWGCPGLC